MKIGLFTATYLDTKLEEVCTMAAELGYQAVELPAFTGNPHLDIEEIVKGSNAKALLKMLSDRGLDHLRPGQPSRRPDRPRARTGRTRTPSARGPRKRRSPSARSG